ncbi:MAG: hypothetical protein LBR53_11175 [Deltaproteobacteria bacterium]|jgi:hypothetical protein|nr:hypothetical protein [Deltaproteobacteria bacterium]
MKILKASISILFLIVLSFWAPEARTESFSSYDSVGDPVAQGYEFSFSRPSDYLEASRNSDEETMEFYLDFVKGVPEGEERLFVFSFALGDDAEEVLKGPEDEWNLKYVSLFFDTFEKEEGETATLTKVERNLEGSPPSMLISGRKTTTGEGGEEESEHYLKKIFLSGDRFLSLNCSVLSDGGLSEEELATWHEKQTEAVCFPVFESLKLPS